MQDLRVLHGFGENTVRERQCATFRPRVAWPCLKRGQVNARYSEVNISRITNHFRGTWRDSRLPRPTVRSRGALTDAEERDP